jgi:hypothetical protein
MYKNLAGLLIMLAAAVLVCALWTHSPQTPDTNVTAPANEEPPPPPIINPAVREPEQAAPGPALVCSVRSREQVVGQPMRVHWKVKVPDDRLHMKDGDYAIRDEKAFANFLGPKSDRYIRWNKVDFSRQMVIAHVFQYPEGNWIDSIVRTQKEIVVFIGVWHPSGPMPPINRTEVTAVTINHSDLPVRFSYFDQTPPRTLAGVP